MRDRGFLPRGAHDGWDYKEYQVRDKWNKQAPFDRGYGSAYTLIIWHKLTGGLQRQWGNKPLKTFTDADQVFRTAMSFRFFDWLTNNRDVFASYRKSLSYI